MTNKSKDIGTKAETATVKAVKPRGFPLMERRQLMGTYDRGDLTGYPKICFQVKGGHYAWNASDLKIEEWMAAMERQRIQADATVGLLVVQRKGVGLSNAHRWWAYMWASQLSGDPRDRFPTRMLLDAALVWLRKAGYGEPLTEQELAKAS